MKHLKNYEDLNENFLRDKIHDVKSGIRQIFGSEKFYNNIDEELKERGYNVLWGPSGKWNFGTKPLPNNNLICVIYDSKNNSYVLYYNNLMGQNNDEIKMINKDGEVRYFNREDIGDGAHESSIESAINYIFHNNR
jgi:hypothetical protein